MSDAQVTLTKYFDLDVELSGRKMLLTLSVDATKATLILRDRADTNMVMNSLMGKNIPNYLSIELNDWVPLNLKIQKLVDAWKQHGDG